VAKIAYIGIKGLPSKGGAERVVEAIVHRLKHRYDLTVYCNSRYTSKDTNIPGIKLICVPTLPGKHLQPFSLMLFSALHALLFGNYDFIHLHNAEACFVAPLLLLRYKVIATSHGPAYDRQKWGRVASYFIQTINYFFVKFPNKLTSVSLPMAEEYAKKWGAQVDYIPNGVEKSLPFDQKMAASLLKQTGVQGKYVLFSAGRIDSTKGCHILIEAFLQIKTDLNLVVVGDAQTDPKYGSHLKNMAKDDKRTCFIPFIADKGSLFGILKDARFFVFPSEVEAMSMALLEAASLGVPIICTDIPANQAVLKPGQALFFTTGDTGELKQKLCWAIDHPTDMKEMGLRAQERVKKKFSWDRVAEEYDRLYRSISK
jgi:glycosyltransferase involved in cell wall biosynthesis